MKFFRFVNSDTNYNLENFTVFGVHQWSLPLKVQNASVALSSLHLRLKRKANSVPLPDILTVKCNLLDRGMANQSGVLKKIILKKLARSLPVYIFEAGYPGCLFIKLYKHGVTVY